MLLKVGNQTYLLKEVEPSGNFVVLQETDQVYIPFGVGFDVSKTKLMLRNGNTKTLDELRGQKEFILLDFWGSWCKGCIVGLPDLKKLALKYEKNIEVVGVNWGDTNEGIAKFLEKHAYEWPIAIGTQELVDEVFKVDAFPGYYLIDKHNKLQLINGSLKEIETVLNNRLSLK